MKLILLGEERVQGDPRGPGGPPYFGKVCGLLAAEISGMVIRKILYRLGEPCANLTPYSTGALRAGQPRLGVSVAVVPWAVFEKKPPLGALAAWSSFEGQS
jgi:hypothetical protein